eukprot:TRINITY_DN15021_c0_g1_i1.p1 TRINITY_DN15021_c0_g1~~TRINITY_DN15021_c0_g1_i1.p1  ORF type:complete len:409 (-),score=76.44 TRINITY_DN15021_c0_g1_i1:46-1272(-)
MSLKDFKIKKFIGKGTYGTVYKVLRISDDRIYALKEINIKYMRQKEREEAVNEIRILASVRHTNVISYCEAFTENDKLYIVTDYADGGDLYEKIKRKKARDEKFTEEQIWSWMIQLAKGLKVLHDQGILHRDLKAPNIFLMLDSTIKIGDLGVAKLIKTDRKIARTQIGTPYYLSPEIWKNRPYDCKSDVWSLGVILYELMALRLPFEAQTPDQLARKVIRGEYSPLPPMYSKELTSLVSRMLQVDPDRRIAMEEVLANSTLIRHMNTPQKRMDDHTFSLYRTIKVPKKLTQLLLPSPKYPGAAASERDTTSLRLPKISDKLQAVAPQGKENPVTARAWPDAKPPMPHQQQQQVQRPPLQPHQPQQGRPPYVGQVQAQVPAAGQRPRAGAAYPPQQGRALPPLWAQWG